MFAAVVLLGPVIAAIQGANSEWIGALAAIAFAAGACWLCSVIGIRLVTGRRRPDGGLFPLWLEYAGSYAAAFLMTMRASRNAMWYGPEQGRRDQMAASDVLTGARAKWNNRRKPGKPNR